MDDGYILGIFIAIAGGVCLVVKKYLPFRFVVFDNREEQKVKKQMIVDRVATEESSPTSGLGFNFRNVCWGMDKGEVKKYEDFARPLSDTVNLLTYKSGIGHLECTISYLFSEEGTLVRGSYDFNPTYIDGNRFLTDFEFLLNLNKNRFGPPHKQYTEWQNRTFEKKKEFYGLAFMEGHLSQTVQWLAQQSIITLFLGHNTDEISFYIEYVPIGQNTIEPEEFTQSPTEKKEISL